MSEQEKLKMLRKIVKPEDVKSDYYSTYTIKSVLFGERQNEFILFECVKAALEKTKRNQEELVKWLMTFKK